MICSFLEYPGDYELFVNLEMDKEFMWTQSLGWNWHKNWNLPQIELTCTVV
jgi:hypothetical protein